MLRELAGKRGTLPQKKFLYDRKGPWPQPSPTTPLGTSAEVLHLPSAEMWDWNLRIGLRYIWNLIYYAPVSAVYALGFKELPKIEDGAMESALTRGIYSRFLAALDPRDRETFAALLPPEPKGYFKFDFTPIEGVTPYPGTYVAKTVALLSRTGDESDTFSLLAIAVWPEKNEPKKVVVLRPSDGDAWQLAKYFVLQGCSYGTLFTGHPNTHFPYDTINAVTKGSIPVDHLLFKLLIPHLRFSLVLNNAVLQGKGSVISNVPSTIYDPFTAKADAGLMTFFVAGHRGIPGNSAYPRYHYPSSFEHLERSLPPTKYGKFLRLYFDPFHELATTVVEKMSDEQLSYAEEWARWIRTWIETFPLVRFKGERGADGIRPELSPEERQRSKDTLAFVLAVVLWDVSVVHSTDHHDFATDIPIEWKCFRLRRAAPASRSEGPLDRALLSGKKDIFQSFLAHKMFFAATTVTHLVDVDYAFGDPALDAAAQKFQAQLREVEESLPSLGIKEYAALKDMAASVQY